MKNNINDCLNYITRFSNKITAIQVLLFFSISIYFGLIDRRLLRLFVGWLLKIRFIDNINDLKLKATICVALWSLLLLIIFKLLIALIGITVYLHERR